MEIHPLQGCTLARRLGPAYRVDVCLSHPALCPPGHWTPERRRVDNKKERPGGGEGRNRGKNIEEERRERWREGEEL